MKSMKLIMETFKRNLKEMELEQEEEIEEIPDNVKKLLDNGDIESLKHGLFFLEDLNINKNELINFLIEKELLPKIERQLGRLHFKLGNMERIRLQETCFWELLRLNKNFENTEYYSSVRGIEFNFTDNSEYIDQVGKLTGLEYLSLRNLGFSVSEIPEEIKNLKNLRILDLFNNNLTIIPEWIFDIRYLEHLDLGLNNLTEIPDSIGDLQEIIHLSFSKNNLTSLPESIAKLGIDGRLKRLYLFGNKFSSEEKARIKELLPDTYISF